MPSLRLPSRKGSVAKASTKAPKASRADRRATRRARLSQLRQAFTLTRQNDSKMLPIVIAAFLGVLVVFVLLGILLHHPIIFTIFGVLFGLLAATSIFGRRAQGAAFAQVEGQPGAAVAVVQSMRGLWNVTPVVAVNRTQDVVHRVTGKPGIILIGEGQPARLAPLIGQEKRRIGRVAAETPIYDLVIGDGDDRIALRKLQTHLMKLPNNLKPAQVRQVEGRLRALGTAQPPVPKGPVPRGARMPRGR